MSEELEAVAVLAKLKAQAEGSGANRGFQQIAANHGIEVIKAQMQRITQQDEEIAQLRRDLDVANELMDYYRAMR